MSPKTGASERPPLTGRPQHRFDLWIPVGATVVAVLAVGLALLAADRAQSEPGFSFAAELSKGLINLAVGALLTGGVSFIVNKATQRAADRREKEREESQSRAQARLVRAELVSELRHVHAQVKTAQVLILTNRTVLTYGEQLRRLMEVRASLGDVRWAVGNRPHRLSDDDIKRITADLGGALGFLHGLSEEFKHHYLKASTFQNAVHKWQDRRLSKLAETLADREEPPEMQSVLSVDTDVAWRLLCPEGTDTDVKSWFPELAVFLEDGDGYKEGFSTPLRRAQKMIENRPIVP